MSDILIEPKDCVLVLADQQARPKPKFAVGPQGEGKLGRRRRIGANVSRMDMQNDDVRVNGWRVVASELNDEMVWTKTNDSSIVDQDGKVILFSTRRSIDICIGNCCFMRSKARGKAVRSMKSIFSRNGYSGLLGNHTGSDVAYPTTMFRLLDSTG